VRPDGLGRGHVTHWRPHSIGNRPVRIAVRAFGSWENQMQAYRRYVVPALPVVLAAVMAVATANAQTADYPKGPVQIIADSAAGATPDVALRFITELLTKTWGKQVLVVNHPGAGGSVAAGLAAKAAPDGLTLYQPVLSTFVSLKPAAPNVPLQVPRDFVPIGFTAENPMFIAVAPSLGINTLPELIAYAKKHPGELSYATTGIGRLTHLAGELLQHEAKIKLLLVPYTGGPSHAVADVGTGRVSMIIEGYSGIAGAARAGTIKLIAVASAQRLADFPDLPTVAETIPGFSATGWAVVVAPLGTSDAIVKKISDDLRVAVGDPELKKKLAKLGSYTRQMSPAEATDFVHKQQAMWNPVLADIVKSQPK
jgi:tripartite-type tricarboxylate transporter receptor subunit TctC